MDNLANSNQDPLMEKINKSSQSNQIQLYKEHNQ